MGGPVCRACRGRTGRLVLNLGYQPACDYFPRAEDQGSDPMYPLQMWLCSACGLTQLVSDPTVPEEPRGAESAALVAQAADAVERIARAGLFSGRRRVAEYGSPHGGSWLQLLASHGLAPVRDDESANVVVDCFGLMHSPNQSAALAGRVARVATGGVLLLQYHSLDTIVRYGQWNALRHGHYAYYSTTALAGMLAANGFSPRRAWHFELYGGTVLLAACRDTDASIPPDGSVQLILAEEARVGIHDPASLSGLQRSARAHARALRDWLAAEHSAGRTVFAYSAASRAVALLRQAAVNRTLLPAVVDASSAKQGLRMPGTDIPIVGPAELLASRPNTVLVLVSDLMGEVRAAFPEVEASGGQWVDSEKIISRSASG